MTSAFSWQNSISFCPASFCTPRPNLPVTPGVSWLPIFEFQSPIMKRTSFLVLVLKGRASLVAQTVKRLPAMWETRVRFLGREDPLEKDWQSTPALLPGKSHGRRSLIGYSPWGHKELDTTECVGHLVMSMCRVFPSVVGTVCLLWPVRSLGKTLLAFVLLHSVLQGQICLVLQMFLDFLLLHCSPL